MLSGVRPARPGAPQIERRGLAVAEEDTLASIAPGEPAGTVSEGHPVCGRALSLAELVHRSSLDMIREMDVVLGPSHSQTVRASCVEGCQAACGVSTRGTLIRNCHRHLPMSPHAHSQPSYSSHLGDMGLGEGTDLTAEAVDGTDRLYYFLALKSLMSAFRPCSPWPALPGLTAT